MSKCGVLRTRKLKSSYWTLLRPKYCAWACCAKAADASNANDAASQTPAPRGLPPTRPFILIGPCGCPAPVAFATGTHRHHHPQLRLTGRSFPRLAERSNSDARNAVLVPRSRVAAGLRRAEVFVRSRRHAEQETCRLR